MVSAFQLRDHACWPPLSHHTSRVLAEHFLFLLHARDFPVDGLVPYRCRMGSGSLGCEIHASCGELFEGFCQFAVGFKLLEALQLLDLGIQRLGNEMGAK